MQLLGGPACGGRLRGLGLRLAQPGDGVGEGGEPAGQGLQLPQLGRQRDAQRGQGGRRRAQPPARRRADVRPPAEVAAGVLEGTGRVGVAAAGPAFGEVRDDREQVRGGPRRICREAGIGAGCEGGGDLPGRPGGGRLRRLPQLLPFLTCQPEPVDPRACAVLRS